MEALRGVAPAAVSSQMMSDVPLGCFLSGGIDSSTIVAFMREAAAGKGAEVNTFSMGFEDGSYNELPFATGGRRRLRHPSPRGHGHAESPRAVRDAHRASRRAVRRRVAVPDLSRVPTGAAPRDRGARRRRRRRALRRLRRLRGPGAGARLEGVWRRVARCASRNGSRRCCAPTEQKKGLVNKLRRFFDGMASAPPDIAQYRWMTFLPRGSQVAALRAASSGRR